MPKKKSKIKQNSVIISISLTSELTKFMHDQVSFGMYASSSEILREALRLFIATKSRAALDQELADEIVENPTRAASLQIQSPTPSKSNSGLSNYDSSTSMLAKRLAESLSLLDDAVQLLKEQSQRRSPTASAATTQIEVQRWLSGAADTSEQDPSLAPRRTGFWSGRRGGIA